MLAEARPLNAAHAPPLTGVDAFTMKPSFAFAKVHPRLYDRASGAAKTALHSKHADGLVYTSRTNFVFDTQACPATDWFGPYDRRVEHLTYTLERPRLHGKGGPYIHPGLRLRPVTCDLTTRTEHASSSTPEPSGRLVYTVDLVTCVTVT